MAAETRISYRNQMIYSVFVRQYGKNGTFKDVEDDLDRIKALGTDIIWLMPIHPIGEKARKGSKGSPYAIRDYRAVNPEFGTLEDFISLTDAIHEKGMKVIIDVVYNHTSPDSVLAKEHPEWFYHKADGSFGNKVGDWWDIIDLDLENENLREYLSDTLAYWAKWVDGFRCDVASVIPVSFWKMSREKVSAVREDNFWLAESVQPGFIRYMRGQGYFCQSDSQLYEVFDALYDYDIYDDLTGFFTGKLHLRKYLESLNRQECIYPDNYIKAHFLENHDQTRLANYVSDEGLRVHWNAFALFSKGIGFVYNGQEFSATRRPELFETDTIMRDGKDISELISSMMKIKRSEICANGMYEVKEIRRGIVKAEYSYIDERLVGYFRLDGKPHSISTDLEEGEYTNELNGEKIQVFHGVVTVDEVPIIISLNG